MFLGGENEAIRCQPVWVLVVAGFFAQAESKISWARFSSAVA